MILLDTHALLWLASGSERLGRRSRHLVDRALATDSLACSAISFWEIGVLALKGRIALSLPAEKLRHGLLGSGLAEIPLSGDLAIAATNLHDLHPDPADRFIVATAIAHSATIVTADARILDWTGRIKRQDARA